MESKTKFLGHPVHPMLIVIPLGLFIATMVIDTVYLATDNAVLPVVSYFNIAVGVIGGLIAALFGFMDWLAIPPNTRAKFIGGWHGLGNVVVTGLMALSWWYRSDSLNYMPSQMALILSYSGVLLGTVTGWLGGELVYRLNVGVDNGANLDAPSALSDKPARTTSSRSTTTNNKPARARR